MKKPYKIVGVYDSETTNLKDSNGVTSFPILHQLGILENELENITPDNVENYVNIYLFRHTLELYSYLDKLIANTYEYVPVICCHNLSFDMYSLSNWLERYEVRVLAKSARKPITFTILDDENNAKLVIWDTLIFSQQSLERMGNDCGYSKAAGEWNYDLIRTPNTLLTNEEINYAKRDIYTLFVWLSWWLKRNPEITSDMLGLNCVTKTGIVRMRRKLRFDMLRSKNLKYNAGRFYMYRCRTEAPKTDDELFTLQAATRGGFTFCAMKSASVVYDFSDSFNVIVGYDATSQHPAQMVSHLYPVNFKQVNKDVLLLAFNYIKAVTLEHILNNWEKPFNCAFYASFSFINLRPKRNSLFKEYGIYPIASTIYKSIDDNDGDKLQHKENLINNGYFDYGVNINSAFGKVISADYIVLHITELTAWEICNAYEWDRIEAINGYFTGRYVKPSDLDIISVMQFYKAKDEFKKAREHYYQHRTINNENKLLELNIAPFIVEGMKNGTLSDSDIENTYLSLKADLNALFGISASNEYRRDTVLTSEGITYKGDFGLKNKPKNPKVWYQFGQRIVGWSRVAQICAMMLVNPHVDKIVNGDTDSIKLVIDKNSIVKVNNCLDILNKSIDNAKDLVCKRIKNCYPTMYSPLNGIGHYVYEFETDKFCASWNKAYVIHELDKRDNKCYFHFTMAGIPTKRRINKDACFIGIDGLADRLYALGWSFEDICNVFLGYNTTYANDVLRLNGRSFPEWGSNFYGHVTDYKGETCLVVEPKALALFPMSKVINDTSKKDNRINYNYAKENNTHLTIDNKIIYAGGLLDLEV